MHDTQSLLLLQNLPGEQTAPLGQLPPPDPPPGDEYVQVKVDILQNAPGSLGQADWQYQSSLQNDSGQKVRSIQGGVVVSSSEQLAVDGAGIAAKAAVQARNRTAATRIQRVFLFIPVSQIDKHGESFRRTPEITV